MQYLKHGEKFYYGFIAPYSALSVEFSDTHRSNDTETWADTLADKFFKENSLLGPGSKYPLTKPWDVTSNYMRYGGLR